MNYKVIRTGSSGNAVIIDNRVLCDCGVPYKSLSADIRNISLVLLTHIHSDHFRISTLKKTANERPMLRFGCCKWLVKYLIDSGIPAKRIDVYEINGEYKYGEMTISPVPLVHNVPQCGYKVITPNGKALYCTDTSSLEGIEAKDFDLYLIESNYTDEDIKARISEKEASGEYAYEYDVMKNHLSKAKCDAFIYENAGENSEYVYLHEHKEHKKCKAEFATLTSAYLTQSKD